MPVWGPRWLSEGSAELFAYTVLVHNGVYSASEADSILVQGARRADKELSTMESAVGLSASLSPYPLSALANQQLAKEPGIQVLSNFYASLSSGTGWEVTFSQIFGSAPEDFYDQFEQYRLAGDLRIF